MPGFLGTGVAESGSPPDRIWNAADCALPPGRATGARLRPQAFPAGATLAVAADPHATDRHPRWTRSRRRRAAAHRSVDARWQELLQLHLGVVLRGRGDPALEQGPHTSCGERGLGQPSLKRTTGERAVTGAPERCLPWPRGYAVTWCVPFPRDEGAWVPYTVMPTVGCIPTATRLTGVGAYRRAPTPARRSRVKEGRDRLPLVPGLVALNVLVEGQLEHAGELSVGCGTPRGRAPDRSTSGPNPGHDTPHGG